MITIRELAGNLYDAFQTKTRDNGEEFVCLKDGSPEWMANVVRAAHGDMLPDDFRYSFIKEAAGAIHDAGDDADLDDAAAEFSDEVDLYNSDLLRWVGSSVTRASYCDDAMEELGQPDGLFKLLQWGQAEERREVFELVVSSLLELAEDANEGEE